MTPATSPMTDAATDLLAAVRDGAAALRAMNEEASAARPAPGKWSPREVIGHLIDSAVNNHPRFVRAQLQEELVFPGYEQEEWVRVQRYQDLPWERLLTLWQAYNEHLAHVMACTSEWDRSRPRATHNFDRIAWQAVSADTPATLDYFMHDYVAHLRHHLRQALAGTPR